MITKTQKLRLIEEEKKAVNDENNVAMPEHPHLSPAASLVLGG